MRVSTRYTIKTTLPNLQGCNLDNRLSESSAFLAISYLDVYVVRFGCLSDSEHRGEVWLACVLWPDKLESSQQGHQDEEELHTSQTLTQTHTRSWKIKRWHYNDIFLPPSCPYKVQLIL